MSYRGTKINPSKSDISHIKFYVILIPMSILMTLPIIYLISTAFKPMDELFAYPPRFFVQNPTLENFEDLGYVMTMSGVPLSRYIFNSVFSSLLVVVGTLLISVYAAYILSKKDFKSKKLLFSINTLSLMFVQVAVRIPRYLIIEKSGLLDSLAILILPMLAMPVGLFLIKQFMDQVPDAVLEAARIDGANDFRMIHKIIIPVIKPAIVTVAILAFQVSWNTADASMFYVNSESLKTFAYYMAAISTATGNSVAGQGIAAAGALVLFIPNLVIFIIMQSNVVNTMAHSGIK
ncbi:MAG: binding-protein-dependent transport systems inner membrane component [Bacteroidetes bacterium]|nr:MAG: binding-protein-dependent transport systems inner membrane component [Bacteroidota bacterium]